MSESITNIYSQKTKPLDIAEIIEKIATSDEYERNRNSGSVERTIGRAALEMAEMDHDLANEENYDPEKLAKTPEAVLYRLVGTLPQYVYGIEGMRHCFRPDQSQTHEFQTHKRRAIKFNHSLKAFIDSDPTLKYSNVVSFVTDMYGVMHSQRWGNDTKGWHQEQRWFKSQIEQVVKGIVQEVLARQIIEAINVNHSTVNEATGEKIPKVIVNANVSVEDDAKGADMYVTLDGVTFPIDIKASERTAHHARKKTRHPKSIITTGIPHEELLGNFRVSSKRARRSAPDMLAKLYEAREEFLSLQAQKTNDYAMAA
ncbi:hypothetical protein EOL96_02950 [Candidatus Saccharibacteria bacterium]|nr:hypothetical protein [Candidatus Saccharibacteria bacterium]